MIPYEHFPSEMRCRSRARREEWAGGRVGGGGVREKEREIGGWGRKRGRQEGVGGRKRERGWWVGEREGEKGVDGRKRGRQEEGEREGDSPMLRLI